MKEYDKQKVLINPANLVEIKYDDLIEEPLLTTKRIYDALKIQGFETSQHAIEKFIAEQKNYKPHTYSYNS